MKSKRSSGLDFSDRAPAFDNPLISVTPTTRSACLQRNEKERTRLQSLMSVTPQLHLSTPDRRHALMARWDRWMVNDGCGCIFLAVWIFLQLVLSVLAFVNYQLNDNLDNARAKFGITYAIASSAGLMLHVNAALILLPVCRNFTSLLRRTPLNHFIQLDKSTAFHKATGWSMVFWTVVHIVAHMVNFVKLAHSGPNTEDRTLNIFLGANFTTGPGITGWIMTACLVIMAFFSLEKHRRAHFERFWYSHHLFMVFFACWQLHGMFCMIQPDRPPFCSWKQVAVFWQYWLVGGVIYAYERVLREVRSRHRTYISRVIQHPSEVVEIQIKKDKTIIRAGQYIFLCCPEISYFQWHPFTLTSAPEADYISLHIRVVGDFTSALAKCLGCNFDLPSNPNGGNEGGGNVSAREIPLLNRVLPRVMIDGPFGSACEDFLNYETVLLVAADIGVTSFASILKSIWYRMNNINTAKRTCLSKVYFVWVIHDFSTAEWFHSLLHAIEKEDTLRRIEIIIYLTTHVKEDDLNNIITQEVGADTDTITSLRSPTHFGNPNWDRIFPSVANNHPDTDVGVFFGGPCCILSQTLHEKCNKYTDLQGTRFFFGKEHF